MQVGHFPASAANSLIEGYCDDFVALAALLAQTLEQVAMRGIGFEASRPHLQRIENGMRELAAGIHEMLDRGSLSTKFDSVLPATTATAAAPTAASTRAPTEATRPPTPPAAAPTRAPLDRGAEPRRTERRPDPPPRAVARPAPPSIQKNVQAPAASPVRPEPAPRTTPPATATPAVPVRSHDQDAAAAEAKGPQPDALRGTNRTMPLQSVFQFLGRTRKSGTLHVFVGDEIVAFEFVNGCIEFTATNHCPIPERLGELLVELGFCTRDRLAPILAKVGVSSANRLGQLVVDERLVSNGQVLEALEAQVLRRYERVCACGDASYEFEPGRRTPGDGRIRIAPFELTIDQPWKLRTP